MQSKTVPFNIIVFKNALLASKNAIKRVFNIKEQKVNRTYCITCEKDIDNHAKLKNKSRQYYDFCSTKCKREFYKIQLKTIMFKRQNTNVI